MGSNDIERKKIRERRDRLMAAAVTFIAALLVFVFLYWGEIGIDRRQMAEASIPEIAALEEEELFLDPTLLEVGEEESPVETAPAAVAQGTPEVVPEPEPQRPPVVNGKSEKPAPPKEKLVTQKAHSEVKSSEPKASESETRKVQSKTAAAFSPDNGNPDGRNNSAGAGGVSVGRTGRANGWKFRGCPTPDVALRNKTVVTVTVTVDENGRVTSAKASGGTAAIREACRRAALGASWTPTDPNNKKTAKGTITFTISPR